MVLLNALLEASSCVYSKITFNIISFLQKQIKVGGGNKSGEGLENFSKSISGEGAIIRYSRVIPFAIIVIF